VTIEIAHGGQWHPLLRLATSPGGVFYGSASVSSGSTVRAQLGTVTSYPWPLD
jgi:hypothetical protein